MDEVGEVRCFQLGVLSQYAIQQVIELSLFFLLPEEVLYEAFGLVMEFGVEGRVQGNERSGCLGGEACGGCRRRASGARRFEGSLAAVAALVNQSAVLERWLDLCRTGLSVQSLAFIHSLSMRIHLLNHGNATNDVFQNEMQREGNSGGLLTSVFCSVELRSTVRNDVRRSALTMIGHVRCAPQLAADAAKGEV